VARVLCVSYFTFAYVRACFFVAFAFGFGVQRIITRIHARDAGRTPNTVDLWWRSNSMWRTLVLG
jgi:hypothetical protein